MSIILSLIKAEEALDNVSEHCGTNPIALMQVQESLELYVQQIENLLHDLYVGD